MTYDIIALLDPVYELTCLCFVCVVCVQSERLLKLQLEDLREFLQEQLAVSFFLPDDVVVEQLQVAMSELRSKKLDQPPPGAEVLFFYSKTLVPSLPDEYIFKCIICLILLFFK